MTTHDRTIDRGATVTPPAAATATATTSWAARVWAPDAQTVDLVLPVPGVIGFGSSEDPPAHRVALDRGPDGWWTAPAGDDARLAPGTRYGFAIDGGSPLPDPRSPRQPDGVHGPSQVVDLAGFPWTDGSWAGTSVLGSVIYEMHVGTFTSEGTFDAAIERLAYLEDLGVDVIEIMPVAAFDGRWGWGYDGVHLYAVHEPYGGPAALQRFVDAAHARGLGVALDVVYNHLGPSGNYTGSFGPYFSGAHETPWGAGINLDAEGSTEVRRWIIDNALRWLRDFHIDALRLDAVHALIDDSTPHILAELSDAVAQLSEEVGRPLGLIAESDENDPRTVTPVTDGGRGMTAQWADDVHHAVHSFLTGEQHGYYSDFGSPEVLRKALTGVFVHDGTWSSFREKTWGHPVPRDMDARRFVTFASDHDQVGNRARGDRPSDQLDPGGLAIAAALVLTSPFTPMLFMGEEWGASTDWRFFTDFPDPELGRLVTEGRTKEFAGHGWAEMYGEGFTVPDPQDPATRDASVLRWDEIDEPGHAQLLDWYRTLIRLRRSEPDLASGDLTATDLELTDGSALIVLRRGSVRVAMNLGADATTLEAGAADELLTAWGDVVVPAPGTGATHVSIPARSVAVLVERS